MGVKKETKLLIFLDDNDKRKDKEVIVIKKTSFGIDIQFFNSKTNESYGNPFFLPWHRVLKLKDIEEKDGRE